MKLELKVTHDIPPQRYVLGFDGSRRSAEDLSVQGIVMMPDDTRSTEPVEVDIVSVYTGGDLSGYVIGQMLRSIAEDIEAADEKLNPPKVETAVRAQ